MYNKVCFLRLSAPRLVSGADRSGVTAFRRVLAAFWRVPPGRAGAGGAGDMRNGARAGVSPLTTFGIKKAKKGLDKSDISVL